MIFVVLRLDSCMARKDTTGQPFFFKRTMELPKSDLDVLRQGEYGLFEPALQSVNRFPSNNQNAVGTYIVKSECFEQCNVI